MEIHLARDGSALGVFADSEVREGLASGRFRATDLAWRQGMSTWTPLAEWPEFAGLAAGAVPSAIPAATPSQLPWEQSRSLGSLARTIWAAVFEPRKFATGRFEEGGSFGLAYAAIAFGFLPILALAVLGSFVQQGQQQALLELLEGMDGEFFEGMRTGVEEAGDGVMFGIPVAACTALVLPLVHALLGLLEWVGLRATGTKVAFGRTVMASMVLRTLLAVGLLPLAFLTGALGLAFPLAGLGADFAGGLLSLVLFALGFSRTLALHPGRLVLAWLVLLLALTCCACGCAGVIGGLAAAGS